MALWQYTIHNPFVECGDPTAVLGGLLLLGGFYLGWCGECVEDQQALVLLVLSNHSCGHE